MSNLLKVSNPSIADDTFNISWALTYKCNLNCPYCNTKDIKENPVDLDRVFEYICIKHKESKKLTLDVYGGEPTTYPDLFKVLDFCESLGIRYDLYSNMVKSVDYYKYIADNYFNLYLKSTLHKPLIKEQLNKFLLFKDRMQVNVLYRKEVADPAIDIFIKNGVRFEVNSLDEPISTDDFLRLEELNLKNRDDLVHFQYDTHTFVGSLLYCTENRIYNFKGWKCNSGKTKQFLTPQGLVYSCEAYSKYKKERYLYNLKNDVACPKTKGTLCDCLCMECEYYVTKYNIFNLKH